MQIGTQPPVPETDAEPSGWETGTDSKDRWLCRIHRNFQTSQSLRQNNKELFLLATYVRLSAQHVQSRHGTANQWHLDRRKFCQPWCISDNQAFPRRTSFISQHIYRYPRRWSRYTYTNFSLPAKIAPSTPSASIMMWHLHENSDSQQGPSGEV